MLRANKFFISPPHKFHPINLPTLTISLTVMTTCLLQLQQKSDLLTFALVARCLVIYCLEAERQPHTTCVEQINLEEHVEWSSSCWLNLHFQSFASELRCYSIFILSFYFLELFLPFFFHDINIVIHNVFENLFYKIYDKIINSDEFMFHRRHSQQWKIFVLSSFASTKDSESCSPPTLSLVEKGETSNYNKDDKDVLFRRTRETKR